MGISIDCLCSFVAFNHLVANAHAQSLLGLTSATSRSWTEPHNIWAVYRLSAHGLTYFHIEER